MTYISSSDAVASNKPYISMPTNSPIAIASGVVQHPLVSSSDQIVILSVIDETGSSSVGDVMAALEGHIDPAGAIQALISAGVVAAEIRNGVLDQHSQLTRILPADPGGGGAGPSAPGGTSPASALLSVDLVSISLTQLKPNIVVVPGARRRALGRFAALQRPGVYVLLSGSDCYVGMSAAVGRRVATGSQLEDVDTVIAITDTQDRLSEADAFVLERIMHARISQAREVTLINCTPDGAPVSPERYEELNLFAATACHALARGGHLFVNLTSRAVLAAPRAEPGRIAPPRLFNEVPDGTVMELAFGNGHIALACHRAEGDWLLLRGSDIRRATVASANASTSYLRAAWLNSGILELAHDESSYTLTCDLVFASSCAAMHFVVGSKGQGRGGWQPIDADHEPQTLRGPVR